MKYKELLPFGQFKIQKALERAGEDWERSFHWWKGGDKQSEGAKDMKGWFREYRQFKSNILRKGMDIEEAFRLWIKCADEFIATRNMGCTQLRVWESCSTAIRDKKISMQDDVPT